MFMMRAGAGKKLENPPEDNPPLKFDPKMTTLSPLDLLLYTRFMEKYGHFHYYDLILTSLTGKYQIRSATEKNIIVPNGCYAFVILQAPHTDDLRLRIGKGKHFYLADKAESLFAAGEIYFKKSSDEYSEITLINDRSGGYHLDHNAETPETLKLKQDKIQEAIISVGLPIDKFYAFEKPQPKANSASSPKLR